MRTFSLFLALTILSTVTYIALAQDQAVPGSDQSKGLSIESKLFELLKERRATLNHALEYQKAQFLEGTVSFEEMLETEIAFAHADLEIAPTLAARQLVHQRLIKQLRQQEEIAQTRFELGKVTKMDVFKAKSARLQAEIEMLRDTEE